MVDINIRKLKLLASLNGYQFREENGQIIYGPPMNSNVVPPKNSEVFIGRLPQDIDNTLVVKKFSEIAIIYTFRVMQNFSGLNRGFAFVQFYSSDDAEKAIQFMNDYEIRPGETIAVTKSRNNCRLYVGKLDTSLGHDRIFNFFDNLTCDLVNLELYSNHQNADGFGYGFLEYRTHKDAAKARRVLKPCKLKLGNRQFFVDWANTNNLEFNSKHLDQLDDQNYHSKINNFYSLIHSSSILNKNDNNNDSLSTIQVDNQPNLSKKTDGGSFQINNLKYGSSPEININQSYSEDFLNIKTSSTTCLAVQEQIDRMKLSENINDRENVVTNMAYGNLSSTPLKQITNNTVNDFVLVCTNVKESSSLNEICRVFTLDQQMRIQRIRRVDKCIFIHYATSLVANLMLKTFHDIKEEFSLCFGESKEVCELMDEKSYTDLNSTFSG